MPNIFVITNPASNMILYVFHGFLLLGGLWFGVMPACSNNAFTFAVYWKLIAFFANLLGGLWFFLFHGFSDLSKSKRNLFTVLML